MNNKVSYTHQYLSRTETFEKKMEDFSAGQKKKVLIAKSLCEQAHLYVWDEPLRPDVKFCVSVFRQSQEWRWKTGRILA